MKGLLQVAGYGLIVCALSHMITHFITPELTGKEKEMLDLMTTLRGTEPSMLGRTMMDFYLMFSWGFSLLSVVLGIFTLMFVRSRMEEPLKKRFIVVTYIFFSLLMVINVTYGILIPIMFYGFCWLIYGLGLLLWPKTIR